MIDPDAGDFSDWADYNAQEFKGYTDYSENFAASVGQVVDEELSISSRFDVNRGFINPLTNPIDFIERAYEVGGSTRESRRNDTIKKLVNDGSISKEIYDQYTEPASYRNKTRGTKTDWNGIAAHINENELLDYKLETDEIMQEKVKFTLDERRRYREDVFSRASNKGKIGRFLGGMVAGALDPIAVATMPVAPLSVAKNLSRTMYTASVAARSAALNVGLQAPIEPMIHAWKEEIGTEYTVAESMFNLAAAGVLGGTISGAAANLGHRYSGTSFLSKNREVLKKQFIKEGFDEADADVLSEYQADINNAPDKGVSVEDHINRGEANLEDLNGRKNADYDAEPVIKEKDQITEEYEKYFGEADKIDNKVDVKIENKQPEFPKSVNAGPMSSKITPITKNETDFVYRESDADSLYEVILANRRGDSSNMFVTDDPTLAIGQGVNSGAKIEFKGNHISGVEHKKPGTGIIGGKEYTANFISPRAINKITISKGVVVQRGITKRMLKQDFDKKNLDNGEVEYTPKKQEIKTEETKQENVKTIEQKREYFYEINGELINVKNVVDDYGVDIESAAKIMECLYNG